MTRKDETWYMMRHPKKNTEIKVTNRREVLKWKVKGYKVQAVIKHKI